MVVILVAGVLAMLLADFAVYWWDRDRRNHHDSHPAKILDIKYYSPTQKGYGKVLEVSVTMLLNNQWVHRTIKDGSSDGRPQFASQKRSGDAVMVWVDKRDGAISLFEPDQPRLFSTLWITSWTVGLAGCLVMAFVLGERVPPRKRPGTKRS